MWAQEIASTSTHVLVLWDGTEAVGVITLRVQDDVADLDRIMVRASERGRGLSHRLMVSGLQDVRGAGARRVLLEVERTNEVALALYRAHGFAPIAQRADYYGPGRDAVVMEHIWDEEDAT